MAGGYVHAYLTVGATRKKERNGKTKKHRGGGGLEGKMKGEVVLVTFS